VGLASGVIRVPDPAHPTMGIIREGLEITEEITTKGPGSSIELIVKPPYRAWRTTQMIAGVINDANTSLEDDQNSAPPIARAIDSVTVRVDIPVHERSDPAGFIAGILTRRISPALLDLEPQIICNRQTGTIVATGNVEISTVAVASKELVVTTTVPPPVPTQAEPIIRHEKWVAMQTSGKAGDRTRVEDLLQAFKQLDVPIETQIEILQRISRSGSLHAKLVIE
jgi:flagellar basal body P-ring protein FlgI